MIQATPVGDDSYRSPVLGPEANRQRSGRETPRCVEVLDRAAGTGI